MPAALPLAFAIGTGAVGSVIAGTAGLAAYATVAGAVLTGVGALTGKKDLVKLGSVLSLGGGIASALGNAGSAASNVVGDMGRDAIGASSLGPQAIEAAASAAPDVASTAAASAPDLTSQFAADGLGATGAAAPVAPVEPSSLMQQAAQTQASQAPVAAGGQFATTATTTQPLVDTSSRLADISKGISPAELNSWMPTTSLWDQAKAIGSGVGNFIEKNPTLVKLGGDVLNNMYGPQAEKMDWERSLYERARQNLNTPIVMAYRPGGKP